jgi:hypothetical protein
MNHSDKEMAPWAKEAIGSRKRKTLAFKTPSKVPGRRLTDIHLKISHGDYVALKEFCDRQSALAGIKVSQSNALITIWRQRHPDDARRANQINKEIEKNGLIGSKAEG